MRNLGIFRGAFIFLFFIGLFALASLGVMYLWNWLIPAVIGWSVINYWQALGLMVLCRLLFGGFRGFGHFVLSVIIPRAFSSVTGKSITASTSR